MADDEEIHLTGEQARGGETRHVTRYVLAISLTAIVVLFAVLLIFRQN